MKKFLMICMLFTLAACSGNKEENKDVASKKAELEKLTKERDAIIAKIGTLETEIQQLSGATVEEKTKLVEVTTLITQDFAHYIDLQGKITTENQYYVTPRGMGGQVKAIYVKQGDNVKAGQLLMKLEDGIIQQNIKQVESQLSFAKNIFTRQENLWKEGIGTEVQFLSAKNNVEGLEKQLSLVKEQLGTTSVIAQVSGVVETVSIRVGETFVGSPMAGITIVNPSAMKAVVEVPENYVVKVRKGMPVIISVPDLNETFNSSISLISETINATSRSFIAESKMPGKSNIKPNQVAVVKILDHAAKDAIVVPVETVQTDEKGKYVYILSLENGKNLARKKMVTIGEFYDELIEVNTGLTKGDKLITKGFQGLYDGQLISTATN
ncbi:MAG: efflux RND transporter periplasmic adaptor subunit [bacterium]|jgi:membrane fusion protein (multidrug efflux system)|nr:efflux RND transporter periplasmic adaptor subunit [Chitinophagaceae bacterium]